MALKTILNRQTDFTGEFPAEYARSGLWRFNENAPDENTQVLDSSGNGRNAAVSGWSGTTASLRAGVHLGLSTLIPKPENLICDGIVVVLLVDLLQELFLQLAQTLVYDLRREGIALQDHRGNVSTQRLQEIILLAEHPVDGVDDHLLQKCFIHRPAVAGVTGSFQP